MKYLAALVVLVLSSAASAERPGNPLEDRFRLTAGVFSATTATDVRIDAEDDTPGTDVSGEDDFGLREQSVLTDVEVELRPRKRHKLRLNYFQLKRRADTVLERQINFGDEVYEIDDLVSARLDISDFNVTYSYMFLHRDRFEIGATFGLHLYQFEGEALVPARFIEEGDERTGPLPAVGLEATVRLTNRLHAEVRAEYLSVEGDEFEVDLQNLRGALFYRFNNNIAVGAGYAAFNSSLVIAESGDSGSLDFNNRGGQLLLRISF